MLLLFRLNRKHIQRILLCDYKAHIRYFALGSMTLRCLLRHPIGGRHVQTIGGEKEQCHVECEYDRSVSKQPTRTCGKQMRNAITPGKIHHHWRESMCVPASTRPLTNSSALPALLPMMMTTMLPLLVVNTSRGIGLRVKTRKSSTTSMTTTNDKKLSSKGEMGAAGFNQSMTRSITWNDHCYQQMPCSCQHVCL